MWGGSFGFQSNDSEHNCRIMLADEVMAFIAASERAISLGIFEREYVDLS